jgi:hypothetical protein
MGILGQYYHIKSESQSLNPGKKSLAEIFTRDQMTRFRKILRIDNTWRSDGEICLTGKRSFVLTMLKATS